MENMQHPQHCNEPHMLCETQSSQKQAEKFPSFRKHGFTDLRNIRCSRRKLMKNSYTDRVKTWNVNKTRSKATRERNGLPKVVW